MNVTAGVSTSGALRLVGNFQAPAEETALRELLSAEYGRNRGADSSLQLDVLVIEKETPRPSERSWGALLKEWSVQSGCY